MGSLDLIPTGSPNQEHSQSGVQPLVGKGASHSTHIAPPVPGVGVLLEQGKGLQVLTAAGFPALVVLTFTGYYSVLYIRSLLTPRPPSTHGRQCLHFTGQRCRAEMWTLVLLCRGWFHPAVPRASLVANLDQLK